MNTKSSYRITSMLMAFLMFTSSIGFSMDVHYCGNEMKSFSFFGTAEPCEMMQPKIKKTEEKQEEHACCHASKEIEEVKVDCTHTDTADGGCCHNETLMMSGSRDMEMSSMDLTQFQQVCIAVIVFVPHFKLLEDASKAKAFTCYYPPPLIRDVSILHQVFRI